MNWGIIIMWVLKTAVKIVFAGLCAAAPVGLFADEVLEFESALRKRTVQRRTGKVKRKRGVLKRGKQTFKKVSKKSVLKYVKPPASSKLYFDVGTDEAELERITLLEIQHIYKLFQTSRQPDIQLRLAALYVEMGRLIESRIYETYDREMTLYKSRRRRVQPVLNLKPVREYSQKAVNLLKLYLRNYPKSKRVDEVLFHLAFSYFSLGRPQEGKRYFERLTRQFRNSDYLEDSYFHLGEFYFENRKWKQALRYYDLASRFKSRYYSFSLYKIAWCFHNMGKISSAMKFMVRVIEEARSSGRATGRLKFTDEALNDLTSFYIFSKYKPSQALAYFQRLSLGKKKLFRLLEKLAFNYKDAGNTQGVRLLFNTLIRMNPNHPQAYDFKYQIVQAYSYTGNRRVFNKEFQEWINQYGAGSPWRKKNRSDSQLIKKAESLIEVTLRNYAFRMHHAFLKTKKPYEKNQALFGYQLYLQAFPDSQFEADMRFHYGEMLFDTGRFRLASNQYKIMVSKYPKNKNHEAAALNRVLALQKLIPSEKEVRKKVKKRSKGSVPIPEVVQEFISAVRKYISFYPKKKNVPDMMYTLAKIYSEYLHYASAVEYWLKIVKGYSYKKDSLVIQSVHSVLDTYNLMQDFDNLIRAARLFLKNPHIASMPLKKEIQNILRQTELQIAQNLARGGKYKESAEKYYSFFKNNLKAKNAITALYNSALMYKKAGMMNQFTQLYVQLSQIPRLRQHKKVQLSVLEAMPEIYRKQGRYAKSAAAFKNYALNHSKKKSSAQYWYNAGLIYDGLNYYNSAVKAYMQYYQKSSDKNRNQIYFLIGRMRERQGQKAKAIGNYKKYIQRPDTNKWTQTWAAFRIAELNQRLGRRKESEKWFKTTIRVYKRLKKGVLFAAKSQFHLADTVYRRFKKIRIPTQPKLQAAAVQKKLKLLDSLNNEVKKVIRLNYGPSVVSALVLMGQANAHLAQAIKNSPIPKGLGRQGRKQYKAGLEQTAQPFYNSSSQYFGKAIDKAEDIEGFTPRLKFVYTDVKKTPAIQFLDNIYKLRVLGEDSMPKQDKAFKNQKSVIKLASQLLLENPSHPQALNRLSLYHLKKGQLGLARIISERILSKNSSASAHNNLGLIALREGNKDGAILAFEKSLRENDDYLPSLMNLSSMYFQSYNFKKAFPLLKRAYNLMDDDSQVVDFVKIANNYAVSLIWFGNFDSAEKVLKKISKKNTTQPDPLINYARLLIQMEEFEDADEILGKAGLFVQKRKHKIQLNQLKKVVRKNLGS